MNRQSPAEDPPAPYEQELRPEQTPGAELSFEALILESLGHAVSAVDFEGNHIYWNKFAESLFGWRADEVLGRKADDLGAPKLPEQEARRIVELIRAGKTWSGQLPFRRRDGSVFEAALICAPLRNAHGAIIGTAASTRDVTARADVEAAIRRSEANLANAQRRAKTGSWTWDLRTGRLERSEYIFEMFGVSPEEFGPGFEEFLQRTHPDDRTIVEENARAAAAGERPLDYEHRIVLPDGSVKVIHQKADLTRDEHGRPLQLAGTAQDITERWQAARALRESELSLANAQRIARLGSWDMDVTTGVVRSSDEVLRLFGFERGTTPTYDLIMARIDPADRARVDYAVGQALAGKSRYSIQFRVIRPSGAVVMMYSHGEVQRDVNGHAVRMTGTVQDISNRWKAEQALLRSELSLANAQRIARIGNWDWDVATGTLRWSDEVFRVFCVDRATAVTYDLFVSCIHPDDRDRLRSAVEQALAGTGTYDLEHRILRSDGSVRVVHEQGEVQRNERGEPVSMSGTVQDITERWEAEEALRRSEERFRAAFDQAPVGICEMTFDGMFTRVNARLCEFFGYSADELRALKTTGLTHPDDLAKSLAYIGELSSGTRDWFGLDKRYIHKSGRVLWAHSTVSLMREPRDGTPLGLIAIVEDVSERRIAEDKLRFQARMLDTVGEAVIAWTTDGTLTYVNDYATSLYGWQKDEAIGQNIVELLVPQSTADPSHGEAVKQLRAGHRTSGEYLLKRRDGTTFYASASATPVLNSAGKVEVIIGVSNDISERKRVQQQLADSEAQLRALTARLQKLREEERTRIAREIHDELGQMLTGLKMDLLWVEGRLERLEDGKVAPISERVVASTELTNSIISAVQTIAADLRPSVLDTLGLASALEFEAGRFQEQSGIECAVARPEQMQALPGEVNTALFRIFQECLTNAARHSGASRVDVLLEGSGDEVHLQVQDNGRGRPDLARAALGSLGLVGIRERAALLGGRVAFSSGTETGTTVDVHLPTNSSLQPDARTDR